MQYTPNYKLPVYEPNDPTSYLVTYNETMQMIDTAIHDNEENITKAATDITGLESQMEIANNEINELTGELSDLTTEVHGNTSNIGGLQNTVSEQNNRIAALGTKVDGLQEQTGTIFRGVLTANEEVIAIPIEEFDQNTLVDVYTSIFGFNPENVELRAAQGGQPNICVITFADSQASDVDIAVIIR